MAEKGKYSYVEPDECSHKDTRQKRVPKKAKDS